MSQIFWREYDRLYRLNPDAANFHLLLFKFGDHIFSKPFPDVETSRFIVAWAKDKQADQKPKGLSR